MPNQLFIIPHASKSLVCKIEEDKLIILHTVKLPRNSKTIIVNDEFICSIGSSFSVFNFNGELLKEFKPSFKLRCFNSKERIVYLGGSYETSKDGGEIFGFLDLEDENFTYKEVVLPIKVFQGKAIDDILILDTKLLLIDNIVYPKYVLEYNINDSKNPIHIETKELEITFISEHIWKGDVNELGLVMLSTCTNREGKFDIVRVLGKFRGSISFNYFSESLFFRTQSTPSNCIVSDICLIDKYLYILKSNSVFKLDITKSIQLKNLVQVVTKVKKVNKMVKTSDNRLIAVGNTKHEIIV